MWITFTAKYAQRLGCGHTVGPWSTIARNRETRETRCRKCHEAAGNSMDTAWERQQAINEKMKVD